MYIFYLSPLVDTLPGVFCSCDYFKKNQTLGFIHFSKVHFMWKYRLFTYIQTLIIFLISSIFFRTFGNVFFSRNLPPTATNVQKVASIRTFSLSVAVFSLIKSKLDIFSRSWIVWVNGSYIVTSSSRFMLDRMLWYKNNLFLFSVKSF